jgi:hypothetical protein
MLSIKVTESDHLHLGTEMIGGEWLMGWIAQTSMDVVGEMVPLPLTKTHLIIGNGTMLGNSALVQN